MTDVQAWITSISVLVLAVVALLRYLLGRGLR